MLRLNNNDPWLGVYPVVAIIIRILIVHYCVINSRIIVAFIVFLKSEQALFTGSPVCK